MTRQSRTLLIIAVLAIGGVSALAFMANRYARLQPLKSVEELPEAPDVSEQPVEEVAGSSEAVDGFVEVRRAVIAAMDADPESKAIMEKELSGKARSAPSRMHYKILIVVRVAREEALARIGMSEDDYHHVRESFIAWMGHKFAEKPADPELVPEFDRRREELEPLYLGLLETLDQ